MKNIAIIIDSFSGGGAERVMLSLAQEMMKLGNNVTFFALKSETVHIIPKEIKVEFPLQNEKGSVRGWFNGPRLAAKLKASVEAIEAKGRAFDIVLVNLHESYRLAHLCDFTNCHYIIHNSFEKELQREKLMGPSKYFYMRRIVKSMSGKKLIAVSKGVTNEILSSSFCKPKSVITIYNPFDIESIVAMSNQPIECDVPEKYIVHVGRAAKAKRHDILFEALKSVDPKVKLVCLSGSTKKLRKLSKRTGIEDRVILPGFTTNPYPWIKKAEVLVLSSDFEGLPTVLIEAITCGTKVVSTACPHGPDEILLGELAQFLVPTQSPLKLGAAINKALVSDIDLSGADILSKVKAVDIANSYLSLC